LKDLLNRLADAAINLLKRGGQVVEKLDGIVVPLVQRDPGDRSGRNALRPDRVDPLAQQRGLAKAGRRG